LTDATGAAILPAAIILPHEYVILTSSTNASKFTQFGRSIGVVGFPSLNNSGEPLALRSPSGMNIDSAFFHSGWLANSDKTDGGWSLERLDQAVSSNEPTNWRASIDTLGGTPGRTNSVFGMNPDSKPPTLDSLGVVDQHKLRLTFSEPVDSSSVQTLSFVTTMGRAPSSLILSGSVIELEFEGGFENGRDEQLLISGIEDPAGNAMLPVAVPFRYFVEGALGPGIIIINEIMADPAPTVHLPEAEFIEIVNVTDSPYDLGDWRLTDATGAAILPAAIILPHEYVILTSSTNASKFTQFGRSIGVVGFPSLNNSGEPLALRSPSGMNIDSAFFHSGWLANSDKTDGGWSLERLDQAVSSNEPTNWRASIDTLGGTPGRTNSVFGMNPDSKPPTLDSLGVVDQHKLRLTFSEPVDSSSVQTLSFVTTMGRAPSSLILSGSVIELEFEGGFENGRDEQLLISGIEDPAGNAMLPVAVPFRYFVEGALGPGIIIINEIMADPAPTVHLPEAEFIEIVNVTDSPYDLGGWRLTDATGAAILPAAIILPHEYVILTSSTNASKFTQFGRSIGVVGFPSLNNSGEPLALRSSSGMKIDSVFFQSAWLADSEKSDGGWSLERLDHTVSSNEPLNWRASIDTLGGTPGRRNSVEGMNPDTKSPTLDSLVVVDQHRLRLTFSERIDSSSVLSPPFATGFGSAPSSLTFSGSVIELHFEDGFENGRDQQLLISGIEDLAGNAMPPIAVPFRYFVEGELSPGIIIINEIMADPAPTVHLPEAEFIEIVNVTDSPYDLAGWTMTDATGTAILPAAIILPHEHVILTSTANASKFLQHGRSVGVTSFPSLSNAGELLALRSPSGMKIDSVFFQSAWLADSEKSDGGWSLERLDHTVSSNEPTNWRASIDTLGGTPGRTNSVFGMNPDTMRPTLDSLKVVGDRELELTFSEQLDGIIASDVERYTVDGRHPVEAECLPGGRKIAINVATPFPNGVERQLLVSGLKDIAGNEMAETSLAFMHFLQDSIAPLAVLINEILADPVPVVGLPEAEFVELVNVSTGPFNLEGWTLSDASASCSLPRVMIHPGEPLVITATGNASKFDGVAKVVGVASFPSLNNGGEPIVLRSPGGLVIDSVRFDITWFGGDTKHDGGWTLERLRYNFMSSAAINWRPSIDLRGGTPGTVNSQFNKNPDDRHPYLVTAIAESTTSIVLQFDEPVEPVGGGVIVRVDSVDCKQLDWSLANEVHCLLRDGLVNGVQYDLSIAGVQDTASNVMPDVNVSIQYFAPTAVGHKDIIINEIMSDPSPAIGLPEFEYVEVFNRSDNAIQLQGWKLSDNNTTLVLPYRIMLPNEYLVLTTGPVMGRNWLELSGTMSLNNDGEYLVISSPEGIQVDSVNYSAGWFRDGEKKQGGWSLELIDPANPCGEENNWAASEDEAGGTPGKPNSVLATKPDLTGPQVTGIAVQSSRSILVKFNEKLSDSIDPESIVLNPGLGEIFLGFSDQSRRAIVASLENALKPSRPYELSVQNLYDCNGNAVQDHYPAIHFALTEAPLNGDIVINEVLFNPRSGGPDFIEIYNRGSRYVDLGGWKIVRMDNATHETSTVESQVLAPGLYRVFTTDSVRLVSEYPQSIMETVSQVSLPSMPDDRANIMVVDRDGHPVDSIAYDEQHHSRLIRDREGVSLERISMTAPSFEPSNWRSAAESAGYATPGYSNSNSREQHDEVVDHVVITPEVISLSSVENFATVHYQFEEPGNFVSCRVVDTQGHMVKEIANNLSVGYEGFLRWDGDRNDGTRARAGYYIVLLDYFNATGTAHSIRKRIAVAPR
jgi:hypothetical protein